MCLGSCLGFGVAVLASHSNLVTELFCAQFMLVWHWPAGLRSASLLLGRLQAHVSCFVKDR